MELNIDYGKIQSTVRQKYDGEKNTYRVKTPGIVAGVRGTIFTVGYESGLSSTSVTEGIVDVRINSPDAEKSSEANGALVRPQQKIQFIASQKKIEVASFSREDIERIKSEREIFKEADARSKSGSKIEADKELKPDQSLKQPQKDSKSGSSSVSPERKSESSQSQSTIDSSLNTVGQSENRDQNKLKDKADRAKGLIKSDRAEEALQNARGQQIKESANKGVKGIEKSAAEVSAERRSEALQKKLKELNTLTQTTNADTKESIKQQAEETERLKAEAAAAAAAAEAKRLAEEALKKAEEAAAKEKAESGN